VFDQSQQPRPLKGSGLTKALAVSVIGLLLAAGMCGIGSWSEHSGHDGASSAFGIAGELLFVVSMLGLVVSLFAIILAAIFGAFRRKK
jgi:hypothetical protein